MRGRIPGVMATGLVTVLLLFSVVAGAEKVNLLLLVQDNRIDALSKFFDPEPSIDYTPVVTFIGGLPDSELLKLIRLYFPRNYKEFSKYNALLLAKPQYYLFTDKQDRWIHDSIYDGAGGINDGSTFSQVPGIPESWASGIAWQAFPNDAPAVVANYAAWAPIVAYNVQVNGDHPEPILTIFLPFGVEKPIYSGVSRVVLPRQGSSVLAWQLGNYPIRQPLLTSWEYGAGRAMTIGNLIPNGWIGYPSRETGQNPYSAEILINMLYWLTDTGLIDDVEVFHRVKYYFTEFNWRFKDLISLSEFIDRFGANTDRIYEKIGGIIGDYDGAAELYLEHDFLESEVQIRSLLDRFAEVEEIARREKDRALAWVYLIEWLVSASVFFVSGFTLWTLMIRRKLYRAVEITRLAGSSKKA